MKRFITFVFAGIAYAFIPELTNLIIINKAPQIFGAALFFYSILLAIAFFFGKLIRFLISNRLIAMPIYMFLSGLYGLALEYTFFGQAGNEDAIVWGMFVYWVGIFTVPQILIEPLQELSPLKRFIVYGYIIYSICHLIIALVLEPPILVVLVPWIWTIVYSLFFFIYLKYLLVLKKAKS